MKRRCAIVHTSCSPGLETVLMFTKRGPDAFATNKSIFLALSDKMRGSHVLGGQIGLEHVAFAISKRREYTMAHSRRFVIDAQTDGSLDRAIERAGSPETAWGE
jgi:hypothetical protein